MVLPWAACKWTQQTGRWDRQEHIDTFRSKYSLYTQNEHVYFPCSLSLSRLDCEEASDEDSGQRLTSPVQQHQSPPHQQGMIIPSQAAEKELSGGSHSPEEDLSYSPVDSAGSSPTSMAVMDVQKCMIKS